VWWVCARVESGASQVKLELVGIFFVEDVFPGFGQDEVIIA